MQRLVAVTALTLVCAFAAPRVSTASIDHAVKPPTASAVRRAPSRAPAIFPRIVRDDFVQRLAAKTPPRYEVEPVRDYRPACCFEATDESTCRVDDTNAMCWEDAGDGCGPMPIGDELVAYWPEDVQIATESGARWGEVSKKEQQRSIREILRVLAERQPAKPVGLVAYAVGYVESGFNPTAEHPKTKACGLYQFLSGTWRDFADADVADDPDSCRDPRENAVAAVRFLSELYDRNIGTIVEQTPEWGTMSEWDRLTTIFAGLYSLHNYGPNDPRWQEPENGARQIALAHVNVLKEFYDSLDGELRRTAPRPPRVRKAVMKRPALTRVSKISKRVPSSRR
jgi:hypothetical protein